MEECAGPVAEESEAGTPALRASRDWLRYRGSVSRSKAAGPMQCGPGHGACQEEGLVLGWMSGLGEESGGGGRDQRPSGNKGYKAP